MFCLFTIFSQMLGPTGLNFLGADGSHPRMALGGVW